MKKFIVLILCALCLTSAAFSQKISNRVMLNDFRGTNLFDVFYIYDKQQKDYVFIPVGQEAYKNLSPENKKIYDNVYKAQKYLDRAKETRNYNLKLNYAQKAYSLNPDLLPAAYLLTDEFKKDKKYSTALYYALQIKAKDKKGKYPNIQNKISEIKRLMAPQPEKPKVF